MTDPETNAPGEAQSEAVEDTVSLATSEAAPDDASELPDAGNDAGEDGEMDGNPHLPIAVEGFTGPLDLLVNLIATHEMDIQKVPISEITSSYLAEIRSWEDQDLDLAGEYLVLASTLVRYKSRSILPREEEVEEEEEEISDELLRQRQLDYERFRQAALELRERRDFAENIIPRPKPPTDKQHEVYEYAEVSVYDLYQTFRKIIEDLGEIEPEIIEDENYSVDEKMIELESFLATVGKLHLPSYLRTLRSKLEIIVVFLSLLELVRLRVILATQEKAYGDIWLVRHPEAPEQIDYGTTVSTFDQPVVEDDAGEIVNDEAAAGDTPDPGVETPG